MTQGWVNDDRSFILYSFCNVTLENFSLLSVWDFSPSGKSSQKKKITLTWFENYLKLSGHELFFCHAIEDCCWKDLEQVRCDIITQGAFGLTFTNGAVHPFRAWRLGEKCSRTRVQYGTSWGGEAIHFHLSEGHLTYMCCRKSDTFFLSACLD